MVSSTGELFHQSGDRDLRDPEGGHRSSADDLGVFLKIANANGPSVKRLNQKGAG